MFRIVTCVSGLLRAGGHQLPLRHISAIVVKTRNTSTEATQFLRSEWDSARSYEDIPGPKPLPLLGNIWRFVPYIGDLPSELPEQYEYLHKKFGIIVKLGRLLVRHDFVMLFDPEDIQKVYRNEGPWPLRDPFEVLEYFRTVLRKDIFENVGGLLVNQGEEWYKFRSKVNPIMMQPRSVQLYVTPMDAVATDFITRISSLRDDRQEMPEDFKNELFKWALESAMYIVLDTRLGCLDKDLKPDSEPQRIIDDVQVLQDRLYELEVQLSFWKIVNTPALREFVRVSDNFTEVALKYINQAAERLKNLPKGTDRELTVLEKILAKDPNPKTAMVMALDTMFAAIHTTAYATAALLFYLAKNPDKQQKLFEEIQRYLPYKDQPITSDILNELKYLKACIKESMRLRPVVVGIIRSLSKDIVLSNYKVPKGTSLVMPNIYLCKQEKYFSQASEYIPERWIKTSEGHTPETKMTHPFVFLPFGFGPRMCVGRRFAELEIETFVARLYRNEGPWPIRDTVPSVKYYRLITRKDVFQGVGGLAVTQGEEWQNFRSKVNQTMMQPRSTKLYVGPIDAVANDFIKRIRQIRGENLEMPDDFDNELCKWGLESIVYIALDTRLGCLDANLAPGSEPQKMIDCTQILFDSVYKLETRFPVWKYVSTPTWRKFVKVADTCLEFSLKYIKQAMERLKAMPEDSDRELTVLEKLLIRDPDTKTAMVMALDMMAAGIDTTAYSTAAALYNLAKNPDKQQKLFEEIQRYLPDKDQPVTADILNDLKYLKACIKESMRMSAIVIGNQRVTVKDLVLANYQIPKGTLIIMPSLLLSTLEKYYPRADKFIPERWIKGDPQYNTKTHPFVTMPFGFGPRMCIGRRFAELEIETLVTKIIRNFMVEYNYEMKFANKMFHVPASPLKFKMVDREC